IPITACTYPTTIPPGCAASSNRKICKRGSAPSAENREALRVTKVGSAFFIFRLLQKYERKGNPYPPQISLERSSFAMHPTLRLFGPGNRANLLLTAFGSHGILFVFGATMKFNRLTLSVLLAAAGAVAADAQTQARPADASSPSQENGSAQPTAEPSSRADAYFAYTMGHIYEQQYENTSKAEYASQAIDFYKKAYALDPKSPVIGDRLAEMYWKAQRTHDAVTEAQEILKRHPNDVPTPPLLPRIYLRRLADLSSRVAPSEVAAPPLERS